MSEHDLVPVTCADVDVIRTWLECRSAPTRRQADRLVELAVIVQRMARTMRPDAIPGWLNTPVPVLDGRWPLELIAGGEYERVARIISSFESPVFT